MGDYQLVLGDARAALALMPSGCVDAVIADIPYNEVNRASNGLRVLDKGAADSAPVSLRWLVRECVRVTAGWVYIWCGVKQVSLLRRLFEREGFTVRLGVWTKTDPPPLNGAHFWLSGIEQCVIVKKPAAPFNRFCKIPHWTGPIERGIDWHPTPKPVWLMRELVTASVPEGGTVLDPFMGSASVGVACLQESRNFIGVEINRDWHDRARRRLNDVQPSLFSVSPL